jgi:hypothetical protein
MKKNTGAIWLAALAVVAVGAGGIWAYETWYAATTINPGAISMVTPSGGTATLALPAGAQSWTSATLVSLAGATATQPAVPTSPGTHLQVAVQKGAVLTITWVDSAGTVQISIITFT